MILVCTYGCSTTVIIVDSDMCYSRLVECLCEKWDELSAGSISLFCKIHGINKCHLDSEEEFQNMVLLAKSMGVQHVEVVVELNSGIVQQLVWDWCVWGLRKKLMHYEDFATITRRCCCQPLGLMVLRMWDNGLLEVH